MKITYRISAPDIFEDISIPEDITDREKAIEYARNVAAERFADLLRSGDAFDRLYKATFYFLFNVSQ